MHYGLVLGYPNKIHVWQQMRTGLIFAMEQKVWHNMFGRIVQVIWVLYNRYECARAVYMYGTTRSGGVMHM